MKSFASRLGLITLMLAVSSSRALPISDLITLHFGALGSEREYHESGFNFSMFDYFNPGFHSPMHGGDELWVPDDGAFFISMTHDGGDFELVSLSARKVADHPSDGYFALPGFPVVPVTGLELQLIRIGLSGSEFRFAAPDFSAQIALDEIVVRPLAPVPMVPEPSTLACFGTLALGILISMRVRGGESENRRFGSKTFSQCLR
jgi:hypothetical protein